MHRTSIHTSLFSHTDLKSPPVNDSETCCPLSNPENKVLYSLGLKCSQTCQKVWKQKHGLYICMGFIQWMDFRGPSVTDAHLLPQVQLIPKEGSLQQPLLLLTLTIHLQRSLHPMCKTQILPHLLHLFPITLVPASRISLRLLVLSHGSQKHCICSLVPQHLGFPYQIPLLWTSTLTYTAEHTGEGGIN